MVHIEGYVGNIEELSGIGYGVTYMLKMGMLETRIGSSDLAIIRLTVTGHPGMY